MTGCHRCRSTRLRHTRIDYTIRSHMGQAIHNHLIARSNTGHYDALPLVMLTQGDFFVGGGIIFIHHQHKLFTLIGANCTLGH